MTKLLGKIIKPASNIKKQVGIMVIKKMHEIKKQVKYKQKYGIKIGYDNTVRESLWENYENRLIYKDAST